LFYSVFQEHLGVPVDDTYPIYETGFLRSMRQLHLVW